MTALDTTTLAGTPTTRFTEERQIHPELPVPTHDVDMSVIRKALMSSTLPAEQVIYAVSMALVDAHFACAIEGILLAKEPGALEAYVASGFKLAFGDNFESSPRTMREAVRRMNAHAIRSIEQIIQPESIAKKVETWLDGAMKKYIMLVVGLKDDYGRLELIENHNNSNIPPPSTVLAKTVAERCRAAVEKVWTPMVDKALAELNGEWEKILADAMKNIKRSFNHKLTRELERRISIEADHRMTELLTRALSDDGGEPKEL
jgi:hypothetical protein